MGEIRDLIGIYGAIDHAVVEDRERRAAVARVLPVYRNPRARWFDEFVEWTRELRPDAREEAAIPSRDDALRDLAEIEPHGRMRARRMFAIAAATRADPTLVDGDSAGWARAALSGGGLATNDAAADALLRLLGSQDLVEEQALETPDQWWAAVLEIARAEELIEDPEWIGPRPCTGRLVMVDVPGVTGPVATLETEFETDLLEFDRAIRFLDPKNWPGCSSFWCAMEDRGLQPSGVRRYHEQVSIDCDHKDAAWTIEAELDFKFRRLQAPHVAITEYELSDGGLPQRDVLVDEGSLVVRELAPKHLRVTTTKRVMFNHAFSGEALALIMCALGYAYIVEDLVFTCARGGAEGTPFPEHRGAAGKPGASTVGPVIAQTATALKACIDDCADAAQSSARRIEEGSYTADSLVQDMATTWVRMLREGATGLEAGIRSAQAAAARSRSREPPPD